MAWERRHGQFYYYRKVRAGGRVRSLYFGRGARAEAAAREDGCAPPVGVEFGEVRAKKAPVAMPAPCATPQLGEVGCIKDAGPWPAFLEVLRAGRDYRALAAQYPAHTLPAAGESLTAWAERRARTLGADDSTPARMG